jgi:hypothetical protein
MYLLMPKRTILCLKQTPAAQVTAYTQITASSCCSGNTFSGPGGELYTRLTLFFVPYQAENDHRRLLQ